MKNQAWYYWYPNEITRPLILACLYSHTRRQLLHERKRILAQAWNLLKCESSCFHVVVHGLQHCDFFKTEKWSEGFVIFAQHNRDNSCCATCIKFYIKWSLTDIIRILIIHVGVLVHIEFLSPSRYLSFQFQKLCGHFNFLLPLCPYSFTNWSWVTYGLHWWSFFRFLWGQRQILIDHKVQLQILSSGKPMILMLLSREKVTNFRRVSIHAYTIAS